MVSSGVLRGGLIGCGYFSRNHLNAWREVDGAEIVATCDQDGARAEAYAREFGAAQAYTDAETMLREASLDFVDVVTQPASHRALVEAVSRQRVPVICQKPLAPSLEDARAIVQACEAAGVPFMVHENFRWQTPMRALKNAAASIGDLFWGRVSFRSAFDVYTNQPYLATDPRFIIYDLGIHLLDLARFYFGEARQLSCQTQRVNPRIRAEDVATILLAMESGATCLVDMSYASHLDQEVFPQTLVHLEGTRGSATLDSGFRLTVVRDGTVTHQTVGPRLYPWSSPPGEVIQDSVVAIQQHWANCLRHGEEPETSGRDNLRTIELVFGAYEAAESQTIYKVGA